MKITVPVCLATLGFSLAIHTHAAEVPAPPASSAADGKVEIARTAFQRGVDLFHEGNFEAALAEFQKANKAAPSFRLLYNIAQAYFELHDYVNAVKAYQQYIVEGGTNVPASRRTQVEDTIQKLQSRIATLTIQVKPEGAQVSVDDMPMGTSPLVDPVKVNPGPRRISASKAGFASSSKTLTVAGSDRVNVVLELEAAAGAADGKQASTAPGALDLSSSANNPPPRSRLPLYAALTTTGISAATAGVFGFLAYKAKDTFEKDLNTFNVAPSKLEDDRSALRRNALITDIAAATAVVAGGVSLYLAMTSPSSPQKSATGEQRTLALLPTPNGVALLGGF